MIVGNDITTRRSIEMAWELVNQNQSLCIETVGIINLFMIDNFAQQFNIEIHFYDEDGIEFTIQELVIKEQRSLQEFENWIYRDRDNCIMYNV